MYLKIRRVLKRIEQKKIWVVLFLALIVILGKVIVLKQIKIKSMPIMAFTHPQIAKARDNTKPKVEAEAYIVIDVDTNTILVEKNSHKKVYPASITKLVTALTALNIYPLDESVRVEEYSEGKNMSLINGDELTVRDLVKALLIHSANDAAYNLALHHRDGINGFLDEMNKTVKRYGLLDTNFSNFDGIHLDNHYSTAYELSQIGRLAIKNNTIIEASKVKETVIWGKNGQAYPIESTNELLGVVKEIEGLKTGWTPEAGGCFISLLKLNNKNLISVVINSPDRFNETKTLIDWAKENVYWQDYFWEEI